MYRFLKILMYIQLNGGDQTSDVTCCGDVSKRVEYHRKLVFGTAKCNGGASHFAVYTDDCDSLLCFEHHFFLV